MRNFSKKGFTLIELIIVMAILAILGAGSFLAFQVYINDANYSDDANYFNQASDEIERRFVTDFAYDGTTDTDHLIRFDRNQGGFAVGTIDSSDSSDLTYAEAAQVFEDNLLQRFSDLSSTTFNVLVCDRDVTNANLDVALNAATSGPFYELVVFTDESATGTDCTGTITAGTTQVAGYTFRYKNANFDGESESYDSDKSLDGGARISSTAINTAGENVKGEYTSINSALTVTNSGY